MGNNDPDRRLFSEFPAVSTQEWEEKIFADLKGADYDKKLIWKTDEEFGVRPYYRSEDLTGLEYLQRIPGLNNFTGEGPGNRWLIRQDISCNQIVEANRKAVDAISRGAGAVNLCSSEVSTHQQMARLLENVDIGKTAISFHSSRSYPLTLELFCYEVNHRNSDPLKINGSLDFDPVSFLLLHGDYYISWENNLEEAEYLLRTIDKKIPAFRGITINGHFFREAGSTLVQELAFSLASANEYLYGLTDRNFPVDQVASGMVFSFGTGSDYFLEIAKIRAARILWTKIIEQYSPKEERSLQIYVHSRTLLRNMTICDPYVNMLRTATEGMSAAIGHSDSISIHPFNLAFREPDEFSERMARNQQLILREEAYLDKVTDPAAGSYYIENLTHSLVKNVWDLFLKIEEHGGLLECIHSGFVQDLIETSARKKEDQVGSRKSIMIGINQYPNLLETLPEDVVSQISDNQEDAPSKFRKLRLSRDAHEMEKLRSASERHVAGGNKRPAVYLLTAGNQTMRKARATFSTNFFGCAGFSIMEDPHATTLEEGIHAALKAQADIVVVCSSDEEYSDLAPRAAAALKEKHPGIRVIVAGYPKDTLETLKQAGVDDFIHVRSNLLETLVKYQKLLGVMK